MTMRIQIEPIERLENDLRKALDECDTYQGRIAKAKAILKTAKHDLIREDGVLVIESAIEALEGEMKAHEFLHETKTKITFNFVCECQACDAEGELTLLKRDGMKPFGCPEGCGANYVPWKYLGKWFLRCVVMPHYAEALEGKMNRT